jgi:hypothetical protein
LLRANLGLFVTIERSRRICQISPESSTHFRRENRPAQRCRLLR